jgi:hypothetical protein
VEETLLSVPGSVSGQFILHLKEKKEQKPMASPGFLR